MRFWLAISILVLCISTAFSADIVNIPMDRQINVGLGDAITDFTAFGVDAHGGFTLKLLLPGSGAGGWYWGPNIDLVKAGYGPYVDMSAPGVTIQYTARYYQGGGNTNPYADAPIFIYLTDVNGKHGGLGISYGPSPNPVYPQWITCRDTITTGDWPTDPDFDPSKVVAISFFGTDWTGKGDDFVEIRNLRVSEPIIHNPIPIAQAKALPDGTATEVLGICSAAFPTISQFYVQEPDRSCGIQVRCITTPPVGTIVYVLGTVRTDPATGEMYIQCSDWLENDTGDVKPMFLKTQAVGGASLARQCGVHQGVGLNNVGLLLTISGTVTGKSTDSNYIYVSDGCLLSDGSEYSGIRVDASFLNAWQKQSTAPGHHVIATGICSLYTGIDDKIHAVLRPRNEADFTNIDLSDNQPKTFKVLVVNFDPFCPGYGNKRTHEVFGWNDPHILVTGYINDLALCSGGWCRYQIVDWFDANYHTHFEDGFQYNPDEYIYAWNNRYTIPMHEGTTDYIRVITDKTYPHNQPYSIAERVASGEIDEVFLFGAPGGSAMWEAAMAGPSPFFVNGGTYTVPQALRNFVLMGFNYERDVDCMLEDFCHRTECVMSRVYNPPSWWFPTYPPTNNWDRFRMFDKIYPGAAACGICHYAPNSQSDYDWGNPTYVWSTCDDWLYNWPNLQGDITKRLVNCTEWGNGDMRLHHIWWLNHLPKAPGVNPDGMQNNWWKYSCDFNAYPESR